MGVCFWANTLHIQFLWLFSRQLILPAGLKNKKQVPSSKLSFRMRSQVLTYMVMKSPWEEHHGSDSLIRCPGTITALSVTTLTISLQIWGSSSHPNSREDQKVSNSASSPSHQLLYINFTVSRPQQPLDTSVHKDKATHHTCQALRYHGGEQLTPAQCSTTTEVCVTPVRGDNSQLCPRGSNRRVPVVGCFTLQG